MGLEQGDWTWYDLNGNVAMVIRYKDGAEMKIDGERVPPPYRPGDEAD